ncbi:hypothetical protein BKA65DRAFT_513233 [Rhexocercosporidium sp. MPI-PUGE-AT-0058]|nr:hypothetical protein BKA65DRAFT_513233 [Rhexocercosporidium sp. MPI-PUGE-AT-0058]
MVGRYVVPYLTLPCPVLSCHVTTLYCTVKYLRTVPAMRVIIRVYGARRAARYGAVRCEPSIDQEYPPAVSPCFFFGLVYLALWK